MSCQRDVPKSCEFKGSGDAHGGQSILKIDPNPHPCERIRAGIHMGRKIMTRRSLTTMALLGLAVATALPQVTFTHSSPLIGSWKLNRQPDRTFTMQAPIRVSMPTRQAGGLTL